ncbi:MAG: acetyl-CoA acetyltransferase [Candidatus Solincola sediminis]|uniref:Probable acetyl-CoA acetyltransferase n=1 Tax=Candidatus Solincola sediminis TaxID=1797199 RepID=A0A1F2WQA7_9ACTN|nr:MAG: acetyl-CoA acetyltransferase [Candidatus Solincola sediminis]
MNEAYIVAGCRTAIGKFGGSLKDVMPGELARIVIDEALKRSGVSPDLIEEVIFGHVAVRYDELCTAARYGALKAGIPQEAAASGVIRGCGSGMQALVDVTRSIRLGDSTIAIAGGVENMSAIPYYCDDMRWGRRMRACEFKDGLTDILTDPYNGLIMGMTAENIAERFGISREDQDAYALLSQQKAMAAIKEGKFKEEIVPVEIKTRKGVKVFDTDEHPTPDTTAESLASLRPAFRKDGTVTAGNASGINDAAAALVLMSGARVEELGLQPMARVVSYAYVGVDPDIMGIGPAYAIPKALAKGGLELADIGVIELNEAFASQAVFCIRELGLDPDKTNLYGGGIALGHPVGCSGARIVITLMTALKERDEKLGLASLCIGGGQGIAMVIERL